MIEIRRGYYSTIENNVLKMYHSEKGWEVISNDLSLKKYGFLQRENYCYKLIRDNANANGYYVDTFCTYKGYKCQILGIKNDTVYLNPSIEYQAMSKDYAKHGYDPQLEVKESELEEIWEERTQIEGFRFDVEPIVYLKRKN